MNKNIIIDMKASQFPFGQVQVELKENKKILIKKRINYKNEKQYLNLQEKIHILKGIYHKNIINFRYLQVDKPGIIDIYYNYVPFAFESFFQECNTDSIRQIHKQLIQLVIHLAKHSILTSFNPSRCGVMLNADNKWQIKYYLPLYQLVVTRNLQMLERAVQIFTVQSLHYLDLIAESSNDRDSSVLSHERCFTNRFRNSELGMHQGVRGTRQQSGKLNKKRRMSNHAGIYQFSGRKLSNMSIRKSQFSHDKNKKHNASTLFETLRQSQQTVDCTKTNNESMISILKPKSPLSVIERARLAGERSKTALNQFTKIISQMDVVKQIVTGVQNIYKGIQGLKRNRGL